jgi:two-component system cell cycle response regulator
LVLIVSEHEWASRSLDTVLAPRGYAVLRAYNGEQAVERARASDPDAVFIDRTLPDAQGPDLCQRLRAEDVVSPATPLLIMTSSATTREQRVEAMRAGAWEVVTLPVDAEELLLRVDRYIRVKLESDKAREEALIDSVTGLYTREGLTRRVRELGAAARRFGRPLACVVFVAGEDDRPELPERTAVARLAEQLRQATRKSDVLARVGPREFVVVAPDTAPDGARILADRLRERAGAPRGPTRDAEGLFAVADLSKGSTEDPVEVLSRALGAATGSGRIGLN